MRILLSCFFIALVSPLFAQDFPIDLVPGDTFQVQAQYDNLEVERLWLLTDRQYKTALKKVLKYNINLEIEETLNKKIEILDQIIVEKDSIIALNRRGYIHYRDLWEETDRKLEEEEIRSSKNLRKGFYIGTAVTAITFSLLKAFVN